MLYISNFFSAEIGNGSWPHLPQPCRKGKFRLSDTRNTSSWLQKNLPRSLFFNLHTGWKVKTRKALNFIVINGWLLIIDEFILDFFHWGEHSAVWKWQEGRGPGGGPKGQGGRLLSGSSRTKMESVHLPPYLGK